MTSIADNGNEVWNSSVFVKCLFANVIFITHFKCNFPFAEREKNSIQTLLCTVEQDAAVHGANSFPAPAPQPLPFGETATERSYEPYVGRWGCEWPSWLEEGKQWDSERAFLGRTAPGTLGDPLVEQDDGVALFNNNNNEIQHRNGKDLYELLEQTQVSEYTRDGQKIFHFVYQGCFFTRVLLFSRRWKGRGPLTILYHYPRGLKDRNQLSVFVPWWNMKNWQAKWSSTCRNY